MMDALNRIAVALERIADAMERSAPRPMIVSAPAAVASLDAYRERAKHCPGCGNLKGKRHNQGCPNRRSADRKGAA